MKPIIKLYEYTTSIKLLALIDDYEACSWERNKYAKGQFSIEINYNIPNATKFRKGLIVQFGNDEKNVGIIRRIQKSIAEDGKGSEKLSITGYDLRDLFSQRIIENLNNNDTYTVSGSGETCIRSLVASQCGVNATAKRRLPIVNGSSTGLGLDCSVSEAYSNLYDVLETIATQSLIGWGVKLVGNEFVLYFYEGIDRHNTVKLSVEFDSLSNGSFDDTDENKVNAVFIGGKGTGDNRDIYEVEDATSGETLSGLNRFEGFSNQSSLTEESEYLKAGTSILTESLQTLSFSGAGLEKCPYVYKDNYDVGDSITVSFSGTTAIVEIVSLSEHWSASGYEMDFDFGKPVADLQRQLKILLTQIRTAEATANSTTKSNVKYYEIPTDTEMPKADVILDVIGFTGDIGNTDKEFELYFDSESKTGAKTYHVYFKNLTGSGKLKLKVGSSSLSFSGGTYVAIIYVDESGEVRNMGSLSDAVVSSQTSYSSEKVNTELNKKLGVNDYAIGVKDYKSSSQFIKIGYATAGLDISQLTHLAGYTVGEGGVILVKDIQETAVSKFLGLKPDYTRLLHTGDQNYTCTEDCYFCDMTIAQTDSSTYYTYINNIDITSKDSTGGFYVFMASGFAKKGDTIKGSNRLKVYGTK